MLLLLRAEPAPIGGFALAVPQLALDPPERQARGLGPQQALARARHETGVRDEHDRRLEALGAVAGQHADLVARPVGIADQLGRVGAQPVQERLERRRVALLEGERLGQERLDRLDRRRAEAREQALAAAARAQQAGIELERRREVRLAQQLGEALVSFSEPRVLAQAPVQRGVAAVVGELEQVVLARGRRAGS